MRTLPYCNKKLRRQDEYNKSEYELLKSLTLVEAKTALLNWAQKKQRRLWLKEAGISHYDFSQWLSGYNRRTGQELRPSDCNPELIEIMKSEVK